MAAVVDWTVDQLLSGVRTVNARVESAQNTLTAARQRYIASLRSLPSIPNVATREKLRAELGVWIRGQLALENRLREFVGRWTAAKAAATKFLRSVHITPPGYLAAIGLVPVAVWGAISLLAVVALKLVTDANNHGKRMDVTNNLVNLARERNWSPEQTDAALRELRLATAPPPTTDPIGVSQILKDALPVVAIIGAVMLLGPFLNRRAAT